MQKSNGARKLTNNQRIEILENRVGFLLESFQTVADSVAEQASACQAMIKVLKDLHPDRTMVKMVTPEGAAFYEFKTFDELDQMSADGHDVVPVEVNLPKPEEPKDAEKDQQ